MRVIRRTLTLLAASLGVATLGASQAFTSIPAPTVVGTIPLPAGVSEARGIAVNSATGRAYVAIGTSWVNSSYYVRVLDGTSVVADIPVGAGDFSTGPTHVAVNEATNRAYVTHTGSNFASAIDGGTKSSIGTVATGAYPEGIVTNPLTGRLYIANTNSGNVSVLNTAADANTPVAAIGIPGAGAGVTNLYLAIAPAASRLWVTAPGLGKIFAVDTTSNGVVGTFSVSAGQSGGPVNAVVDPASNKLYVTRSGLAEVLVLNGSTGATVASIPVAVPANGIAINPTLGHVYATTGPNLTVVDTTTDAIVATAALGAAQSGSVAADTSSGRVYVSTSGSQVVLLQDAIAPSPPNVVVNTNDSGPGSLRAAIEFANTNAGPDTIVFNIPRSDPGFNGQSFVIRPTGPLGGLMDGGTAIEGSTQSGFTGDTNPAGPEVEIDGSLINDCCGLFVPSSNNRIEGLTLKNYGAAIHIGQGASGNVVTKSQLGPNRQWGVILISGSLTRITRDNRIVDNVISGNGTAGVHTFASDANTIERNRIVGNSDGVAIQDGPNHLATSGVPSNANRIVGNVVSGNGGNGVSLRRGAVETVVQGNSIGTDAAGAAALPNRIGLGLDGSRNLIGGPTAAERNVISGNKEYGLCCGGTNNVIRGNYIGTNAAGTAAVPNGTVGMEQTGIAGINLGSNDNTIAGNLISGNIGMGIRLAQYPTSGATGNVIKGNLIGTDASGTAAIPNTFGGVGTGYRNTTIGGPTAAERNVISGNGFAGIAGGGSDHVIESNYIGTAIDGTAPLPNGGNGVNLNGAQGVAVRGNVIAKNAQTGLFLAGVSNATIGGATQAARNVISGNGNAGIRLIGPTRNNMVSGNYIGVDASGRAQLGNALSGVVITNVGTTGVPQGNVVARNVISGNGNQIPGLGGVGVLIVGSDALGNRVQGNWIGTDESGTLALGNDAGVFFHSGSHDNVIGGSDGGAPNVIAFNRGEGVGMGVFGADPVRNRISRNLIYLNGGLGIDLGKDGVTPNDAGDADTGPNMLMNFPVITQARLTALGLRVVGRIDTPNPETVTIEIYANGVPTPGGDPSGYGEGAEFLGTATPTEDGAFNVVFPSVPEGTLISATATDAAGNTSEFAKNRAAQGPPGRP